MDLTGQRYGRLTVIEKTPERYHGQVVYKCRCDCGNIKKVPSGSLRNGSTTSCGCLLHEFNISRAEDLTGKRFGFLTVIEPAEPVSESGKAIKKWKCKCDCEKETIVFAGALKRGDTKSCGCLQRKREDLTGKRFGRLTAIRLDEERTNKDAYWICRCDCGNETSVYAQSLKNGKTKSCGCIEKEALVEGTKLNVIQPNKKIRQNNKVGCTGVYFNKKTKKYRATIGFKGQKFYLKEYETLEDAIAVRKEAEQKIWGEFLDWYIENFPGEWERMKRDRADIF